MARDVEKIAEEVFGKLKLLQFNFREIYFLICTLQFKRPNCMAKQYHVPNNNFDRYVVNMGIS